MLHLVTLLTDNYFQRAQPFLHSLHRLSGITRTIIRLGDSFTPFIPPPHIICATMPLHWSASSPGMMEHGRWLDALPDVRDDDVYLFSDADIVVQRDFYPGERALFAGCPADEFLIGWNAGIGDNLEEEALRIGLMIDDTFAVKGWSGIPCFNTGILAMRGIAWKRLRDLYESRCERFYQLTSHRSRQQWLICWCLHRLGLQANILPLTVHCHAHFSIPKGVTIRDRIAYYHDETILFRHAF